MSKQSGCEFEQIVVKSSKSGVFSSEIAEHLQTCVNCRETVKLVQFFQTNLLRGSPPENLPAAGLLWWKSRLREKKRAAGQVAQPILIAQIAAGIIAFATLIWLMISRPAQISSLESAFVRVFASMEQIIFPVTIGIICFALISTTLIFALRRFMLEK